MKSIHYIILSPPVMAVFPVAWRGAMAMPSLVCDALNPARHDMGHRTG